MIFPKGVRFIPCVLGTCIFLAYSCCFVIADEDCYRGEALLDYDNPCSGDSGQPATYELCHRGQRLEERCTERCVSCDDGINYQNTFTNCSTCLPCKTAADCLPGQIIKSCTVESDTVCGCPSPPPCPVCPSCPTATPCPLVTPCPVQTECPACECPTDAPVTTEPQPKLTFIRECPAEKLIGATSGSKLKSVEWEEPLATDGATITQSHRPGDSFVVGNTTVIYVFEIESHSIFCSFVVTVTEETVPPTTPFSRDETTEGNKPETDFQKKNDCNCWPCWILLILLVVVICLIVIIVAGCTCCKEYLPEEWTCCENCLPKVSADPEAQQPEAAHNEDQGEDIPLNQIEQNPQPPGNNDPDGDDGTEDGSVGTEDGSARTSDANSNRGGDRLNSSDHPPDGGGGRLRSSDQPPDRDFISNISPSSEAVYSGAHGGNNSTGINSRTPLISSQPSPFISHQNPGPSGVQYLTQNSRTPLIPPQSPPSSALPHQGIDRLSSSDHLPDRDSNSAVAPFSVSSSAYGVAQGGSDTADSSTQPLLTSSSPSSAMPSQNPGTSGRQSFQQNDKMEKLKEDLRKKDREVQELKEQLAQERKQTRECLEKEQETAASLHNREPGNVSYQTMLRASSSGRQQGKSKEDLMYRTIQEQEKTLDGLKGELVCVKKQSKEREKTWREDLRNAEEKIEELQGEKTALTELEQSKHLLDVNITKVTTLTEELAQARAEFTSEKGTLSEQPKLTKKNLDASRTESTKEIQRLTEQLKQTNQSLDLSRTESTRKIATLTDEITRIKTESTKDIETLTEELEQTQTNSAKEMETLTEELKETKQSLDLNRIESTKIIETLTEELPQTQMKYTKEIETLTEELEQTKQSLDLSRTKSTKEIETLTTELQETKQKLDTRIKELGKANTDLEVTKQVLQETKQDRDISRTELKQYQLDFAKESKDLKEVLNQTKEAMAEQQKVAQEETHFSEVAQSRQADYQPSHEIEATITKTGGVLEIPNTGVVLVVPPSALPREMEQCKITMRIISHSLEEDQEASFSSNSSAVVELLPDNLMLQRPVKLRLPHCLVLKESKDCTARIFKSHHEKGSQPQWVEQTHLSYHLEDTTCTILLKSFCWVKYSVDDGIVTAKKLVVYAAAKKLLPQDNVATIAVGYYSDLPGKGGEILQMNQNLIVSDKKTFFFRKRDKECYSLHFSLDKIFPNGWQSPLEERRKEVPYETIASIYKEHQFVLTLEKKKIKAGNPLCVFTVSQEKGQIPVHLAVYPQATHMDSVRTSDMHIHLPQGQAFRQTEANISQTGGTIEFPGTGVVLEIPPGALPAGMEQCVIQMRIIPSRRVQDEEVSFFSNSSVAVELCPDDLRLQHPVRLKLPHCLELQENAKHSVRIFTKHHSEESQSEWEEQTDLSYSLEDATCNIWIDKLCCVKYLVSDEIVIGKKIVVYTATRKDIQKKEIADVEVGYYPGMPGAGELLQMNPNLNVDFRNILYYKEKQRSPLQLSLDSIVPSGWKCCFPKQNPQEIPFCMIAWSVEHSYLYILQNMKERAGNPACKFTATQEKGDIPMELVVQAYPQISSLPGSDGVASGHTSRTEGKPLTADSENRTIRLLSTKLREEWRDVCRSLRVCESMLYRERADNPTNIKEAIYQCLLSWKQEKGKEATFEILRNALVENGRGDLADDIDKYKELF